jgi:hypothetical protein
MAKKKYKRSVAKVSRKTPKKTTRRRRRMGAMALNANSPLVLYGSIALGYFFGDKLNAPIKQMIGTKVDAKILGAGEAVLGYFVGMRKGKVSVIQKVAGGALIGAGAKELMTAFGMGGMSPYGMVPVVNGAYGNVPVINGRKRLGGYTPNNSMAGYTPNMSINKVMGGMDTHGSGSGLMSSGSELMG